MNTTEIERFARERIAAYTAALTQAGIAPHSPVVALCVLTTRCGGLGEAIEVAAVNEAGETFERRIRPRGEVQPGASLQHHLRGQDLEDAPAFAEVAPQLWAFLSGPGPDGQPRKVVAWEGEACLHSLQLTAGGNCPVYVTDMQRLVKTADETRVSYPRYRPQLQGMRWTVPLPETELRSALSIASALMDVLRLLWTEQAITTSPVPFPC